MGVSMCFFILDIKDDRLITGDPISKVTPTL